jgi:hypothetical protein
MPAGFGTFYTLVKESFLFSTRAAVFTYRVVQHRRMRNQASVRIREVLMR